MSKKEVINLIKTGAKVNFVLFREGVFIYRIGPFEFIVPLEDVAGVTLLAEDKGIYFMRWINKYFKMREENEQGKKEI